MKLITDPVVHYVQSSNGGGDFPSLCLNAIVAGERSGSYAPGVLPEADLLVISRDCTEHKNGVPHDTPPAATGEDSHSWHFLSECGTTPAQAEPFAVGPGASHITGLAEQGLLEEDPAPEAPFTAADITDIIVRAVNQACRRHGLSALATWGEDGALDCFLLSAITTGQRFRFTTAEEPGDPAAVADAGPSGRVAGPRPN